MTWLCRQAYGFLDFSSLAICRSAKSTPTRIFEAFHNCTRLMTFFMKQIGKVIRANASG